MNLHFQLGRSIDLSVPLDPHGPQPSAYGVPPATARPYSGEGFILSVAEGGSCNCEVIQFIPHCQSTHTESVGHITRERFPLTAVSLPMFMRCSVISVEVHGREILGSHIEAATANIPDDPLEALVIRTLPNDVSKRTRHWENDTTPYFTPEAMSAIRARGVKHLLVDLPSVDPLYDGGHLAAHRVFWDMGAGSTALPEIDARQRTITELIFVPDEVADGPCLLTIQFPHIVSDAVPSRPILFFPDADDDPR